MNSCAVSHPIPPVYDSHSRILILGSFPSVKSRENGFFYGHSRNRFWKTVSAVIGRPEPKSIEEKKKRCCLTAALRSGTLLPHAR